MSLETLAPPTFDNISPFRPRELGPLLATLEPEVKKTATLDHSQRSRLGALVRHHRGWLKGFVGQDGQIQFNELLADPYLASRLKNPDQIVRYTQLLTYMQDNNLGLSKRSKLVREINEEKPKPGPFMTALLSLESLEPAKPVPTKPLLVEPAATLIPMMARPIPKEFWADATPEGIQAEADRYEKETESRHQAERSHRRNNILKGAAASATLTFAVIWAVAVLFGSAIKDKIYPTQSPRLVSKGEVAPLVVEINPNMKFWDVKKRQVLKGENLCSAVSLSFAEGYNVATRRVILRGYGPHPSVMNLMENPDEVFAKAVGPINTTQIC